MSVYSEKIDVNTISQHVTVASTFLKLRKVRTYLTMSKLDDGAVSFGLDECTSRLIIQSSNCIDVLKLA